MRSTVIRLPHIDEEAKKDFHRGVLDCVRKTFSGFRNDEHRRGYETACGDTRFMLGYMRGRIDAEPQPDEDDLVGGSYFAGYELGQEARRLDV